MMLKIICKCDRCGREFQQKESKTVIIKNTSSVREEGLKLTENSTFENTLKNMNRILTGRFVRDYCPECVAEFKDFLNMKGEKDNEYSSNQH